MAEIRVGVNPIMPDGRIKLGLADQARAFEAEARRITTGTLRAGGIRFKEKMRAERLSGAPGLNVKTGRLKRSLRCDIIREGDQISMQGSIGRGAHYAEEHEDRGRLKFAETFQREARRTEDELRVAYEALGRTFGRASSQVDLSPPSAGDSGRQGLLSELGAHHQARKTRARELRLARKAGLR